MLIPVRCYTCGKVTGNKWDHYNDLLKSGKTQPQAFKILGLKRYCCKRILLGHIDIVNTLMAYETPNLKIVDTISEIPTIKEEEIDLNDEPIFN